MSHRIQSLAKVSDLWLDSSNGLRQKTVQALQVSTGLSPHQIDLALKNCFEELSQASLERWVSARPSSRADRSILHVLPSNAFTAWVHGATLSLLAGFQCDLKASSREPIFANAWKTSLEKIDPALGQPVRIVSWDEKNLSQYHAVAAYGSDETLQKIKAVLPPDILFAGFGHKLSVGIVFEEALGEDKATWLEKIVADATAFRLQGCLSPQILYMENYQDSRWIELDTRLDVAPKIRPFTNWVELKETLRKFVPYLSAVGYAGGKDRESQIAEDFSEFELSRVCPLGEMQRPPLTWRNGGVDWSNLLH
jgi:hypothetical protein